MSWGSCRGCDCKGQLFANVSGTGVPPTGKVMGYMLTTESCFQTFLSERHGIGQPVLRHDPDSAVTRPSTGVCAE